MQLVSKEIKTGNYYITLHYRDEELDEVDVMVKEDDGYEMLFSGKAKTAAGLAGVLTQILKQEA